jgi:6,7-dimethyl-8-ribityllumazine synthase
MKEIKGSLNAEGLTFGIVVSRFNDFITKKLLDGAVDGLLRQGASDDAITAVWVPGAFEIPLIAKQMAESGKFHAIICLGTIIRGATAHFDLIAGQTTSAISTISLETGIPVIFGVLTTDTIEQAIERAGTKSGNKGFDAAQAAIEMSNLKKQVGSEVKQEWRRQVCAEI